ncbi:TIGR03756 family integrating conjugative element protein [Pseudomaricurvus alkylphenolicus]|uniref:TIGR03756 family integrating conjugative element protein n=1 Tax=Pseudomaricurvus alkylphenolicus TaxID=1306991 RepID=UPI0014226873|nr:TIGR03756 family integrating conjugative element protein [Pseudomaricurvus alkylphenolicus]NIB44055.1 TIGR03756 family integrating conjugative element protein [Pseudomaricurvus alkylphenolicus]
MKHVSTLLIGCVLIAASSISHSGRITTAEIVSHTTSAALSCMRWTPVGVCFWLRCSLSGCSVRTSIKVGHYQPDAVVSAYNELGGNPWLEIRASLGLAQRSAADGVLGRLMSVPINSAGNRTEGGQGKRDHRNLIFRETDVIGHPVSVLSSIITGTGYLCRSQTRPFFPYFQSGLDALSWRMEVPEMFYPASVIPGLREIGRWPWQTWGSVYPRTGWTTQTEEPKAAAINAQRAGDIVTRRRQPHIYVPIRGGSSSRQRVWPPRALVEGNPRTGVWQMLLPRPESSCRVFGQNDLASWSGWGGGKVDPEGDYAWNLWRPYSCCRDRGTFLFDINWIRFP